MHNSQKELIIEDLQSLHSVFLIHCAMDHIK
jgi:hypothetical protein